MSRSVRTPDLVELRSFVAAADLGSLGRAALRMHVSQPALSKRLQSLEAVAGVQLLERSPRGVRLTPAGRRLYEQARRVLHEADALDTLMEALAANRTPVLVAASHSAAAAFVADVLVGLAADPPFELVTANSSVVRQLVADRRAEVGIAPRRPGATPNPGVREIELAPDEIVYAVPRAHPWARLPEVSITEFSSTPVVVRDIGSNARWTVQAVLRERGITHPPIRAEGLTPTSAMRQAAAHGAPLLLSHRVINWQGFKRVGIRGLRFPRTWDAVLPAVGEPSASIQQLIDLLREAATLGSDLSRTPDPPAA